MNSKDLEDLVSTIRQFLQKARNQDDAFEYCRLCDELKFAEAALAGSASSNRLSGPKLVSKLALA